MLPQNVANKLSKPLIIVSVLLSAWFFFAPGTWVFRAAIFSLSWAAACFINVQTHKWESRGELGQKGKLALKMLFWSYVALFPCNSLVWAVSVENDYLVFYRG